MELAELRARLGAWPAGGETVDITPESWDPGDNPVKYAAVLVPIIHGPAPGVLLTQRTTTLSSHAGQVAFPGGRMDPGESAEETALREAEEEVGLPADRVELVGRLPDHMTGTGYRVTPIVGLLAPGFVPVPAASEVAAVFELPLTVLLDPAAPELREREYKGRMRSFWVWPHAEHYIWGATAAILVQLARRLREEAAG